MEESKQYPFTNEEIKAIASLKRAFTKCDKLGLKFSGMADAILVCNKRTFDLARKNIAKLDSSFHGEDNEVAFALRKGYSGADNLISNGPYVDSGGW